MKEVTRIHIAKVGYEIELPAKKRLETYIDALSTYADDANVIEDIEIRITELLETRGVKGGGIITVNDIEAIQETLGEPQDFISDGDMAIGEGTDAQSNDKKKLYRSIDDAVLGGVLSGMAAFMGVNAVWVRLAFIVLLFMSFGFAAFIYALLWVITPAATSVTQKLQMRGEPITLSAIKKFSEDQVAVRTTQEMLARRRKVFGVIVGVLAVLGSVGAALMTAGGITAWMVMGQEGSAYSDRWDVLALFAASGMLLTLLGLIVSYAGFTSKVTKKIVIAACAVMVAGIVSFSSAVGIISYHSWQQDDTIRKSVTKQNITLPENISTAKKFYIDTDNVSVEYTVGTEYRASMSALPGTKAKIVQDGDSIRITVSGTNEKASYAYRPVITITGPQIAELNVAGGVVDYIAKTQDISVTTTEDATVSLAGNFGTVNAVTKDTSSLNAANASVRDAKVNVSAGTEISLGNIDSLESTLPTVCPNSLKAIIEVQSVRSTQMVVNGIQSSALTTKDSCWEVSIDSSDE